MKRVSVDSDWDMHLVAYVDEVLAHCDVCRPFDAAPRVPVAGTSTASMFNEKLHVDFFVFR